MLTVKIQKQKEYLLPQRCIYCDAEIEKSRNHNNYNKVSRIALNNRFSYYRCPKCWKLHVWVRFLRQFVPLIVLLFTLHLEFTLYREEIITNKFWNAVGMITLLLAAIVIIALFENLANNYPK